MKNIIERICSFSRENLKFVVILVILLIGFGTIFSIFKSFEIRELKIENAGLRSVIQDLNTREEMLKLEQQKSNERWNIEKRSLLLEKEQSIKQGRNK